MSGPFCAPCPTGSFKYDFSYADCRLCENKPIENAFYTSLGAKTSNCPYECESDLDPSDVNPRCENALQLAAERTGGIFSTLLVAAGILAVTFALWTSLMIHSKLLSRDLKQSNRTVYDGVLFTSA